MREIFGMNMIGEHIMLWHQGRRSIFQSFNRQAVLGINTRHAQNGQTRMRAPCPCAQRMLGIHAPPGAGVLRIDLARLVNQRSLAIPVHASRADINEGRTVR